jgi:hypothetical protein
VGATALLRARSRQLTAVWAGRGPRVRVWTSVARPPARTLLLGICSVALMDVCPSTDKQRGLDNRRPHRSPAGRATTRGVPIPLGNTMIRQRRAWTKRKPETIDDYLALLTSDPTERARATPARDSRSRARSRRVHQLFPTRVSSAGTTGRGLRRNADPLRVLPDERDGCGEAQTGVANLRHE